MTMTARQILRQELGDSKNFMTPGIMRVGKMSRNIAYELSTGRGMDNEPIYGVTLVMLDESTGRTERLFDDSQMFESIMEAVCYIADYKQRC